jgi:single-strand DNA-binding protein
MGKSFSNTVIVGRVGTEPEVKTFNSGTEKAEIRVAVNRVGKGGAEATDWYTCGFWGKAADVVKQYVRKGDLLTISGRLESNQWQDRQGNKRESWELNVQHFVMMDQKAREGGGSGGSGGGGGGGYSGGGGYGGKGGGYGGGQQQSKPTGGGRNDWLDDDDDGVPF